MFKNESLRFKLVLAMLIGINGVVWSLVIATGAMVDKAEKKDEVSTDAVK